MFATLTTEMLSSLYRLIQSVIDKNPHASVTIACLGCGQNGEEVSILAEEFYDIDRVTRIVGIDKRITERTKKSSGDRLLYCVDFNYVNEVMDVIFDSTPQKTTFDYNRYDGDRQPCCLVLFVSWPDIHKTGIANLLSLGNIIVYVGKNDGCTACGDEDFWARLMSDYIPILEVQAHDNDMVVYLPQYQPRYFYPLDILKQNRVLKPREENLCYNPKGAKTTWRS